MFQVLYRACSAILNAITCERWKHGLGGRQISPGGTNRRHKKTGTVAGFSVYPGCIERHLESMFGAPRENRVFYIKRGLQLDCVIRDTDGDTRSELLPHSSALRRHPLPKRLNRVFNMVNKRFHIVHCFFNQLSREVLLIALLVPTVSVYHIVTKHYRFVQPAL